MSSKNISLSQTNLAFKELSGALSECSRILNEKKINAEQKDVTYKKQLENAQQKIDMLRQSSQNAINNINELAAKLDKALG